MSIGARDASARPSLGARSAAIAFERWRADRHLSGQASRECQRDEGEERSRQQTRLQ